MSAESKYVWLQGELVPYDQATVHFNNASLHYGLGVFEGIRCYKTARGPAVFRLREHLKRLLDSARIFALPDLPYSLEDLRQACHEVVRANGFEGCYIRPLIYFDDPPTSLTWTTCIRWWASPPGPGARIWARRRWSGACA